MKNNKLTIMEKLYNENERLQKDLNALDSILKDIKPSTGEAIDILEAMGNVMAKKRQVCAKWLKLAYEVAPPKVRIAKTIKDLEAVWQ